MATKFITDGINERIGILGNKSVIRFVIVGCINTGVDFLVFILLRSLFNVNYLACQVAGYSMGIINSFIMNKFWTFENQKSKFQTHIQFVRFLLINFISLGISLYGLRVLKDLNINIYLSKAAVTLIAQVVNYVGYKVWVFKN